MAFPPILILGGAGALLLYLLSGSDKDGGVDLTDLKHGEPQEEDKDEIKKDPPGSPVNGICAGYTGMDMNTAQGILKANGYKGADGKVLAVDGKYGTNTKAALVAFQSAKGITGDNGYLCAATGDALAATLTTTGPVPKPDQEAASRQFGLKDGYESAGKMTGGFALVCANTKACDEKAYNEGFRNGAYKNGYDQGGTYASAPDSEGPNVRAIYASNTNASWQSGFRDGLGKANAPRLLWPDAPTGGSSLTPEQKLEMETLGMSLEQYKEYKKTAGVAGDVGSYWASVGATVDVARHGVVMARARRAAPYDDYTYNNYSRANVRGEQAALTASVASASEGAAVGYDYDDSPQLDSWGRPS